MARLGGRFPVPGLGDAVELARGSLLAAGPELAQVLDEIESFEPERCSAGIERPADGAVVELGESIEPERGRAGSPRWPRNFVSALIRPAQ